MAGLGAHSSPNVGGDDRVDRLEAIFQTMHDGFVTLDGRGTITSWNPSAERILGWTAKEATGRHVLDLLEGEHWAAEEFAENMRVLAEGGEAPAAAHPIERELPRRDGTRVRVRIAGRTVATKDGFEVAVFVQDVSEQRKAEEELRQQAHYLRDIEALAGIGVWSWDPTTDEVTRSSELLRLHGLEGRAGLTNSDFLEAILEKDRSLVTTAIREAIQTQQTQAVEYRIVRPDGSIRWVNGRIDVEVQDGRAARLYGATVDITSLKEQQQQMQVLQFVMSSAAAAIITFSLDGKIESWSPGAEELFGYSTEEAVGLSVQRLVPEEDRPALQRSIDSAVHDAGLDRRDAVGSHQDGTRFDIQVSTFAVRDGRDTVGIASIIQDVSSEKRARAALEAALSRESETAAALRELQRLRESFLAAVSHELRTPLTSIIGYAEVLSTQSIGRLNVRQRAATSAITRGGERLERLVDSLLTYSSMQAGTFELRVRPVEVVEVLRSVEAAASPIALTRSVDFHIVLDPTIGRVTVDVDHITRALLNIVRNAIKFTPAEGKVTVSSSCQPETVVIQVEDTGIGIEPKELAHLINPFSRSSAADGQAFQGVGLGLVVAARVLRLHGGDLTIESTIGSGTTVRMLVPRYPRPEAVLDRPAA